MTESKRAGAFAPHAAWLAPCTVGLARTILVLAFVVAGFPAAGNAAKLPAPVLIRIDADGVAVASRRDKAGQTVVLTRANLGAQKPKAQAAALHKLRKALAGLMDDKQLVGAGGTSKLRMVLELADGARWRWAQWTLQVGASPRVGLRKITLRRAGAKQGARIELPEDRGLVRGPAPLPRARLRLYLFRKNLATPDKAFTRVRIGADKTDQVDLPPAGLEGAAALRTQALLRIRRILERKRSKPDATSALQIVIGAPPPMGGAVPCGDVLTLVEMVQDLKLGSIVFEGTALPAGSPAR